MNHASVPDSNRCRDGAGRRPRRHARPTRCAASPLAVATALALMTLAAAPLATAQSAEAPVTLRPPLTLADCLRLAEERSLTLANAQRDQAIAAEEIRQVRAQALPGVRAEAGYTWLENPQNVPGAPEMPRDERYQATAQINQLLYSGGAVRAALEAAGFYRDGAEARTAITTRALQRAVAHTFVGVLQAEAAAAVAEESLRVLEGYAEQTERKQARGLASEFDALTARVRVANERPLCEAARHEVALAYRTLWNLLNLEEHDTPAIAGALTAPTNAPARAGLVAQAYRQRPELAVAAAERDFHDAGIRVERSAYRPEVRAFAAYRGNRPGEYDPTLDEWQWSWQAGAVAVWDLFDGGLRRGKTAAVTLKRDQAEATRAEWRQRIRFEVQQAELALDTAQTTRRGSLESVRLAERAMAIARTRHDQGLSTYLEFTDANLALSRARLNRLNALAACRRAWIDLHHAAGGDVAAAALEEGEGDE